MGSRDGDGRTVRERRREGAVGRATRAWGAVVTAVAMAFCAAAADAQTAATPEARAVAAPARLTATPTFNPPPGTYAAPRTVAIASATPRAQIRYTLDGSSPSRRNGALYAGPLTLTSTVTLRAIAFSGGRKASFVATGRYTVTPPPPPPPPPGPSNALLLVAALTPQSGALTLGAGNATLLLTADKTRGAFRMSYGNLSGPLAGAHVHAPDGAIVFDLDQAAVQADGSRTWTIVDAGVWSRAQILAALDAGTCYVNLHTARYPIGEIKGFLRPGGGSVLFTPPPAPPALPTTPPTAAEAARFLRQATYGPTLADIAAVQNRGYAGWIADQLALPRASHLAYVDALPGDHEDLPSEHARESIWKQAIQGQDQLRQRVALALSELFVVSDRDDDLGGVEGIAGYMDVLAPRRLRQLPHAAGGRHAVAGDGRLPRHAEQRPGGRGDRPQPQRELRARDAAALLDRPLPAAPRRHPAARRRRAADRHLRPGDGARASPASSPAGPSPARTAPRSGASTGRSEDWRRPDGGVARAPLEREHQAAPERRRAAGRADAAEQDLAAALDNIFQHPNVGPFVCRHLIQRLVTSNPSPAYVYRCGQAFANDGTGARGDLAGGGARHPARLGGAQRPTCSTSPATARCASRSCASSRCCARCARSRRPTAASATTGWASAEWGLNQAPLRRRRCSTSSSRLRPARRDRRRRPGLAGAADHQRDLGLRHRQLPARGALRRLRRRRHRDRARLDSYLTGAEHRRGAARPRRTCSSTPAACRRRRAPSSPSALADPDFPTDPARARADAGVAGERRRRSSWRSR